MAAATSVFTVSLKVEVIIFISSDRSDFKVSMYWKNCSAESGADMVIEIRN